MGALLSVPAVVGVLTIGWWLVVGDRPIRPGGPR